MTVPLFDGHDTTDGRIAMTELNATDSIQLAGRPGPMQPALNEPLVI